MWALFVGDYNSPSNYKHGSSMEEKKSHARISIAVKQELVDKIERIAGELKTSKNAVIVALLQMGEHPIKVQYQRAVQEGLVRPHEARDVVALRKQVQALPSAELSRALELLRAEKGK